MDTLSCHDAAGFGGPYIMVCRLCLVCNLICPLLPVLGFHHREAEGTRHLLYSQALALLEICAMGNRLLQLTALN